MTELKSCSQNFFPELCGVNVIVDPQGSLGTDDDRILVIAQKGDTGTAAAGSLHKVLEDTRTVLFGLNSMANAMVDEVQDIAPTAEVWVYVLDNTGTSSTAEIEIAGVDTALNVGAVYVWVNGQSYQASFNPATDTNASLAAKLQAVISASDPTLLVTTSGDSVMIETLINGEIGGALDVRLSYGRRPDLTTSSELTVTEVTVAATGLPIGLAAISGLTEGFEFVVNPYVDDNSMNSVAAYLCSQWSGGSNSRAFGLAYGDAPALEVLGQNANNGLFSYMGIDGALTPSFMESATYTGLAFNHLNSQADDIASSMTGQVFPAMLAPEEADLFSGGEKAGLVESGVGYFNVTRVNDVNIGRAVTTFTVNDNGSLNTALRDVNTTSMIAFINTFLREEMTFKYNGYSFRNDGIVGGTSVKVATVPAIRNFMISLGQRLSDMNIIQDMQGFIEGLELSVNADGCVEIVSDPTLVKPFCCSNITLRTK